jgi:hypothetical protein
MAMSSSDEYYGRGGMRRGMGYGMGSGMGSGMGYGMRGGMGSGMGYGMRGGMRGHHMMMKHKHRLRPQAYDISDLYH